MTTVAERPTEGEALERSSFTSLFTKDWNNCYWVMQGNLLLLYANKEMYLRNPTQGRKTIKLTAKMHISHLRAKSYKGYGELHKFALEEEIDHGKSVVARFAAFTEEAAEVLHANIYDMLSQLRREAGIEEEEEDEDDDEEQAPAPANKNHKPMWAGMDG